MAKEDEAEFQRHLQHGVMFCDGPNRVECICGWTCTYEDAEKYGFESWERTTSTKKAVLDALEKLNFG